MPFKLEEADPIILEQTTKNVQNKAILLECCKLLGLQEDVELGETKGFRWTLLFKQSPNHPEFTRNMIKLERMIQETTKRPVDLRLPRLEDKNKRAERNVLNERK